MYFVCGSLWGESCKGLGKVLIIGNLYMFYFNDKFFFWFEVLERVVKYVIFL